jgi:hypothetical protein
MEAAVPSYDAPLAEYRRRAAELLAGHRAREPRALDLFHRLHPRFLEPERTWKPRDLEPGEVAAAELDLGDAELAVARGSCFRDWAALVAFRESMDDPDSPVRRFEAAVEAVLDGDLAGLDALLARDPALARARSSRSTCFDPPQHRATLLHYLAANGVENHRQRSPRNAVAVARRLLDAGAEVDALADLYGGQCTTLSLLVSSSPPAERGVQVPLVHLLVERGADLAGRGAGPWTSPLTTALVFGFRAAAEALVERGAAVSSLDVAAGLGRLAQARALLPSASPHERHRALALAAQLGRLELVELLLDAGEDPDRYNPEALHAHATPLHHAALAGDLDVVRCLVARGARLDLRDRIWHSTPLGWAQHAGQAPVAEFLLATGAPD